MDLWPVFSVVALCAACLVGYILTGSIVRYRGGITTCPQMLPHYRTWRAIAIHVRDLWGCVTNCGKRRQPPPPVNPFSDDSRPFSTLPEDEVELDEDEEFCNVPNEAAVKSPTT